MGSWLAAGTSSRWTPAPRTRRGRSSWNARLSPRRTPRNLRVHLRVDTGGPRGARLHRWTNTSTGPACRGTGHTPVVLTAAGISTDSGIPDFRGPNGVWTKDPAAEKMATLQTYMSEPEVRRRAWRNRLESPTWQAEPNAGHRALVDLERRGVLHTLVTQNVDGLHQAAGSDPDLVVEIHGTMREVMCMTCGGRRPMPDVLEPVLAGDEDPVCTESVAGASSAGS